jgi:hypothetical protein
LEMSPLTFCRVALDVLSGVTAFCSVDVEFFEELERSSP